MKQSIKLTESELRNYISKVVKKVLNEGKYLPDGYDEEWEKNVDDNPYEYHYDDKGRAEYGGNFYDNAKKRLDRLNADNKPMRDMEIYGWDNGPYGYSPYTYNMNGQKIYGPWEVDKNGFVDTWDNYDQRRNHQEYIDYAKDNDGYGPENARSNKQDNRWYAHNYAGKGGERMEKQQRRDADKSYRQALKAADSRPLHRKGSLNRAMDDWHGKK